MLFRFALLPLFVVALATQPAVATANPIVVGEWSDADRASLAAGVQAVPQPIRDAVGAVRFARISRNCPFAIGVYNKSCPTFATVDRTRTFFVYDGVQVHGDGPPTRLRGLNEVELRDVLVRRAAVHAYLAEFDRAAKWSEHPRWRQLNFWREQDQPFNRDAWGYSRYLGMRSAHLDLVTFAEEYFVPPHAVLAASKAPDAPARLAAYDHDLATRCQAFSKGRFVAQQLAALDPTWVDPHEAAPCEAFESWASLDTLDGIEILYAAATADRPQSLWGHLLLHIRHADRADGFEPVYQFGAVIAADTGPVEYLTRGLMGGFYTVFDPSSFRDIDREFLQSEQRTLKRYRLTLSREQSRLVLERIWEMERRARLPYWFFDENCAAFLQDMLASALDVPVNPRSEFIVAPTDVLDALAEVRNPTAADPEQRLLVKLPDEELSNRERARWAQSRRAKLLAQLARDAPDLAALAPRLVARDASTRATAHEALAAALNAMQPQDRRSRDAAAHLLAYGVTIERYYLESHIARANAVWGKLRLERSEMSVDERLQRRRQLYEHEDAQRREEQRVQHKVDALELFANAPRRELRPREAKLIDTQDAARNALTAAIDGYRSFVARAADIDPQQIMAADETARRRTQQERDARSIGRSGKGRVAVGAAAVTEGTANINGRLRLDFAFLSERLGSQRKRGFRPDIETEVMAISLLTPLPGEPIAQLELDAVLLRYVTIERLPRPARRNWLDGIGYGFDLTMRRQPRLGSDLNVGASAGLIAPLAVSHTMTSFLVVGAFPAVSWHIAGNRDLAPGGVRLFTRAQLHLFGNFANVVRLHGEAMPFVDLIALGAGVAAEARLEFQLLLGTWGERPLLLIPHATAERDGRAGRIAAVAGIRLESAL